MTAPVLKVEIDFANGPSFSYPLLLDNSVYGILDTNTLGDVPADVQDISDMVMRCSTRRGRNRILSNFEAGSATVTINDPDSDFNPQNSASPYWDPVTNSSKVIPLRKIRIYAETEYNSNTVQVNLFAGYITSYDTGFYPGVYDTSVVTLQCVDGFRLLNNVSTGTDPIPGATAGQLSGDRIEEILDFANFPSSMRTTDAGNSTMQVDPGGLRSVLQAVQTVEQSEFGAFFMQRSGKTLFLSRDSVAKRGAASPRTYTDAAVPDPGEFPYSNIDFAFDDQLILNDVSVTRLGGTTQEVISQPSIDRFFTKAGQRTGILVENDTESLNQALTILSARENSNLRIDSIDLNMYATINELNTFINLNSDIYNLILAEKQMSGGSTIIRELFIQGVQHDITPTTWTTKLLTAEPLIQAFVLDAGPANDPNSQGVLGLMSPVPNTNALSY